MFDIFLIIIFFSSAIGILYIILSKLPQLAAIRLEIIPSEQQWAIRNRIAANRLKGKIFNKRAMLLKTIRPFWLNFTSLFWRIYKKVLEKERHLQQMAMNPEELVRAKTKIAELLGQAKRAVQENKFIRAERLYINVVSLEPKNLDAYEGLTEMYRQQKDYQKANETLKFLINLAKKKQSEQIKKNRDTTGIDARLAKYYLELGELRQYQGDNESAMENFLEALKMEERNPKALDQLLEISIILKKIDFAKEMMEKMKVTNPQNQKIVYWEGRIRELEE